MYLKPDVLILHAHRCISGSFRYTLPVVRLPPALKFERIGRTLREMLGAHREHATPLSHEEFKNNAADFLRATKFRSWRALEASAKSCFIAEHDGAIVFTPLRNGGAKGSKKGFQPGASDVSSPRDASNEALGRALMDALARSE